MIVGLVGWIGSGKGTAGDILSGLGFRKESFAGPLKDAVSVIFGWDRDLLEGDTEHSRTFREETDNWWSERFGFNVTPRLILQQLGTECIRDQLHESIWIYALENRLQNPEDHIVLTDVRFSNELQFLKNIGGVIIQIKRGEDPEWVKLYKEDNTYDLSSVGVHESEYGWIDSPNIDYIVTNNGTKDELKNNLIKVLTNHYGDTIINELYL